MAGDDLPQGRVFSRGLTLDSWGQMAPNVIATAIEEATRQCQQLDEFKDVDRIPVALCSVEDLEMAGRRASPEGLMEAIRLAAGPDQINTMLSYIVDNENSGLRAAEPVDFPFTGRLGEVLPWWTTFEDRADIA